MSCLRWLLVFATVSGSPSMPPAQVPPPPKVEIIDPFGAYLAAEHYYLERGFLIEHWDIRWEQPWRK